MPFGSGERDELLKFGFGGTGTDLVPRGEREPGLAVAGLDLLVQRLRHGELPCGLGLGPTAAMAAFR